MLRHWGPLSGETTHVRIAGSFLICLRFITVRIPVLSPLHTHSRYVCLSRLRLISVYVFYLLTYHKLTNDLCRTSMSLLYNGSSFFSISNWLAIVLTRCRYYARKIYLGKFSFFLLLCCAPTIIRFSTSEQKDLTRDHHRKPSLIDWPKHLRMWFLRCP